FSPSTKPVSLRPRWNARRRSGNASGGALLRKPTTGIAGCCALAAIGRAAFDGSHGSIKPRRTIAAADPWHDVITTRNRKPAARLRGDARGCDGSIRQELADGIGYDDFGEAGRGGPPITTIRRGTAEERFATILLPNSVAKGETG